MTTSVYRGFSINIAGTHSQTGQGFCSITTSDYDESGKLQFSGLTVGSLAVNSDEDAKDWIDKYLLNR